MSLDKFISPYIASQFPRLYLEEGPDFIAFVKLYYEWMEQADGIINEMKSLPEYRDIDTTTDDFLNHFKNKYMVGLPEDVLGDKRTLQKHIKEIYSSKGTAQGLELLFRLLYNETSEIYLPGDDILRPSDGLWVQPVYLEVSYNPYNVLLVGEKITGRETGATAIVEDFQVRYINKRQINVLFLSNLRGNFATGEIVLSDIISDPLSSPSVIGSATDILINESGFGFKVGDTLEVGEGSGMFGRAVVSSVSPRNGAVSFTIVSGGSGYANNSQWAPNDVRVEAIDPDNPGIGADFEVGEIIDTEVITTAVDAIAPYANTQLNSSDYGFPYGTETAENVNTPLDQALNIQDITVGTIKSLRAINPGAGYNGPVNVFVDNPVISGLMISDDKNGDYKGNNAIVDGKASAGNGAINTVKIINSGIGYANGDVVTLTNANVPYIAGGAIILGKQGTGEGYWRNNRSFLNSDKYIQDSYYYQEYSYETRLSVAFSYYSDLLKKLWHPAGTQGFGKVVISSVVDSESEAVEVDIVATRITEYMTLFGTYVLTTRATATQYLTQFATLYPTEKPTLTSRNTYADYLADQPNQIINGSFDSSVDNWTATPDATISWTGNTALVTRGSTAGAIYQSVAVANGTSYQLEFDYTDSTGGVTAYLSTNSSIAGALTSNTFTGAANSGILRITSNVSNLFVILEVTGSSGDSAEFDNIVFRTVPVLERQTEYVTVFNRDTAVSNGSRLTTYDTTTAFITAYNTIYNTAYDSYASKQTVFLTSLYTASQYSVSRSTNKSTSTIYDTLFNTVRETSAVTNTYYNTSFLTTRATTTQYLTSWNTVYLTNRDTTTTFNTTYDTVFNTSFATTTTFGTIYGAIASTNRDTTTTFDTTRATDTTISTSRATQTSISTSRATTTAYTSTVQTSKSTDTSRTTTYNTTYNTTYVTTFNTVFLRETVSVEQDGNSYRYNTSVTASTTRSTVRSTVRSTSKTTTYATTTTYGTAYAASRSTTTTFISYYNTTTVFNTSYATTTAFETTKTTNTVFDTNGQSTVQTTRSTDTIRETNFQTVRSTSLITTTVFERSVETSSLTSRSTDTTYDTMRATGINTTTVFNTNFDTNRSTTRATSTIYNTLFVTTTLRLTDVETSRSTLTSVATPVSRSTTRATTATTTRATATSRTTVLATVIATSVSRDTSRLTVFIAYPTSYLTSYNTLTTIQTDYQTTRLTSHETNTVYDTEYPTERQTSVLTQTDVAD